MTVKAAYEQRHGASAKIILRSFGVEPNDIIDTYESRLGVHDSFLEMIGQPQPTAEDFADAAYWDIINAIKAAYFGSIPRTEAEGIVTTLRRFPTATITLCEELEYNHSTFARDWEASHPDEPCLCPIDWNEIMP